MYECWCESAGVNKILLKMLKARDLTVKHHGREETQAHESFMLTKSLMLTQMDDTMNVAVKGGPCGETMLDFINQTYAGGEELLRLRNSESL